MNQTNILSSFLFLAVLIGVAAIMQMRAAREQDLSTASRSEKDEYSYIVGQLEKNADRLMSTTGIEPQSVVDHASACRFAVIFVDADWSLNARFFRPAFSKLVVGYHMEFPNEDVRFHYVNGTRGFESLTNLPGYREITNNVFHGNGEILWLAEGRIVHMSSVTSNNDPADLIRLTQQLAENAG